MDNMKICRKIVGIEGLDLLKDGELDKSLLRADELIVVNERWEDGSLKQFMVYNPLTDDGLCFQLMVKYDLDIIAPYRKNNETTWEAHIFSKDYADAFQIYDKSPNRAICLAIIEANKEDNNG